MIKLDSDIMGIIMALLTFLIPVISAIFEKNRKKKKGGAEDVLPDEESISDQPIVGEPQHSSDIEEMFNQLLGLDVLEKGGETPVEEEIPEEKPEDMPVHIPVPEEPVVQHERVAAALPADIPDEAVPSTSHAACVQSAGASGEIDDVPAKKGKRLKERLKENPADMVLFAEIMKPKYKEL